MADLIEVDDADDPRLADYRDLRDVELRKHLEAEHGLFLAEGEKVVRRAVEAGYTPRSFLMAPRWLDGLPDVLAHLAPCFVVSEDLAERGHRVPRAPRGARVPGARPLPSLDDGARARAHRAGPRGHRRPHQRRCDPPVGAALGVDAVLLSPRCADPLYRRSVKVAMGAVFSVPWTRVDDWYDALPALSDRGFTTVAMTLAEDAVPLDDAVAGLDRVALVLGGEGHGLSPRWEASADRRAIIPMREGIDSLNVAAAPRWPATRCSAARNCPRPESIQASGCAHGGPDDTAGRVPPGTRLTSGRGWPSGRSCRGRAWRPGEAPGDAPAERTHRSGRGARARSGLRPRRVMASAGPRFFGLRHRRQPACRPRRQRWSPPGDQCAFNAVLSPAAAAAEDLAGAWLKEQGNPATASVGLVTGVQMTRRSWGVPLDATSRGRRRSDRCGRRGCGSSRRRAARRSVAAAPGPRGGERRAGRRRRERRDGHGGPRPGARPRRRQPTIVCPGRQRTPGPATTSPRLEARAGAWAHVDGAFAVGGRRPARRHLVDGVEGADWGDGRAQVAEPPYDSGSASARTPTCTRGRCPTRPTTSSGRVRHVRRCGPDAGVVAAARGFAAGRPAALGAGGRRAVERPCRLARRFAEGLAAGGAEVVNEVVLNQVLVGFGDDERTDPRWRPSSRTAPAGWAARRGGRRLMRVSVSNYTTTEDDVDRSVRAVLEAARYFDAEGGELHRLHVVGTPR